MPFGASHGRAEESRGGRLLARLDAFVPPSLREGSADALRRARLIVTACGIAAVTLIWVIYAQWSWGSFGLAALSASAALIFAALPLLLRWTGSVPLVVHLLAAVILVLSLGVSLLRRGESPAALGATSVIPLVAVLLGGRRIGVLWAALTGLGLAAAGMTVSAGVELPLRFERPEPVGPFRGAMLLTGVSLALGLAYEWLKDRALQEVATARRRRAESEARFRALAENASDGISEWDAEGQLLYVSPCARAQFGLEPGRAAGREDVFARIDPDDAPALAAALIRAAGSGRGSEASFRVRQPDGEPRWLEVTIEPFLSARGEPRLVAVARDVTDRREIETLRRLTRELEQTTAELSRTNRELEEFTSIASHDLQEPARRLVAFSQLLREDLGGELPDAAATDLGMIGEGARRMQELVQDLLVLSRAGSAPMKRARVRVDACADRALEALALRVEETGARITRDALPELDADATLLTAIYQNLIGNALKFVEQGPPRIELTAELRGGLWLLGVRDAGIGVPEAAREDIFKPFRRLHGRDRFDGSGIGLAICRKAVERHGGRIWVESGHADGAYFRFQLEAESS